LESYGPAGTNCPTGWNRFSFSAGGEVYCWINAVSAAPAPAETISSLDQTKVTGTVAGVTGPDDSIAVTLDTTVYSAPGDDHFPDLDKHWNIAEFNVFGDGGGDQAVFNNGSTVVVRTSVDSGTLSAPTSDPDGFTGETNNLTLVCKPELEPGTSTAWPSIKFAESNFSYLYRIPGKLVYLSASPDSLATWGINQAGEVWRYLGAGTPKNPWQQVIPGKLQQISLGGGFIVWGVNDIADIYQFVFTTGDQGAFKLRMANNKFPLPNIPDAATWIVSGSVAAASDNTVWAAMTAETVYYPAAPPQFDTFPYRWDGETFKLISFPAVPVASIAVGSSTNVWALDQSGNIYSFTGHDDHPWNDVPGNLIAISAAADGTVWGVNRAGQAWEYTGPRPPKAPAKDSHPWRHVPGPGKPLSQISVGSKISVWALDSEGGAYSYSSPKGWTWWNPTPQCPLGQGHGTLTSISALTSGGMWGLNMNTGEIWAYNFEP
jgi:virginiamycin B lyase